MFRSLSGHDDGKKGTITVKRINADENASGTFHAIVSVQLPREHPYDVEVKAGDLLSAKEGSYRSYRVVRVVPPQPIESEGKKLGRIVGWIEVDPVPMVVGKDAE